MWPFNLVKRPPSSFQGTYVIKTMSSNVDRNSHAQLRAAAMKKSWSTDSLFSLSGARTCVCAPTTHAGSFRCRFHRQPPPPLNYHQADAPPGSAAPAPPCRLAPATTHLTAEENKPIREGTDHA
ncbi:hypothetical protein Taro_021373 [Colocasia esculenta]|uniref:Uncharacterized protein n=1 Tax=Colocasia esculenta TaxID=4460 RepID=A0A843UYV8_COLES|nr:hypothetical protein [Colocasia esculenta]